MVDVGKLTEGLVLLFVGLSILFAVSGSILTTANSSTLPIIGGASGVAILGVIFGAIGIAGAVVLLRGAFTRQL